MAERPKLRKVMFQVDPSIPPGEIRVGGTLVLSDPSDEELGFAAMAKLVRADEETLTAAIGKICEAEGALELKRLPDIEPEPF